MSILASCGDSVEFHLWPSGVYVGSYDIHDSNLCVESVSWCHNGDQVVAVLSDGVTVVIKPPTSKPHLNKASQVSKITGLKVNVADFSTNNFSRLALGTLEGEVLLYDLTLNKTVTTYPAIAEDVSFLQFSPNDLLLAAGCGNGQIIVYNSKSTVCASFVTNNSTSLSAMEFYQNDCFLLGSGSNEGIVCVWNTELGTTVLSGQHHDSTVSDVAFCPNELLFASVGADHKFICNDLRSPELVNKFLLEREPKAVAFMSANPELAVASADGWIFCYDRRQLHVPVFQVDAHMKHIKKIAFQRGSVTASPGEPDLKGSRSGIEYLAAKSSKNKLPKGMEMDSTNFRYDEMKKKKLTVGELEVVKTELLEQLEEKVNLFEDQIDQCFFQMRIDVSKMFIGLEDEVDRNVGNVLDALNVSQMMNVANSQANRYSESPRGSSVVFKAKSTSSRLSSKN